MEKHGLGHLVPYNHDDFETWTKSLQLGLRTDFDEQNLIVGGGLDDVWHNPEIMKFISWTTKVRLLQKMKRVMD